MNIGPYTITRRKEPLDFTIPDDIDKQYEEGLNSGKRLILGTLVARSGTRSLCEVFSAHEKVTGVTERYGEAESFFRYVTFHNLPIDTAGIIQLIKKGIVEDWKENDISLVFSPYFSHGLEVLVEELKPEQTIIGLAEPRFTVQSIYNKNVFSEKLLYNNLEKVIGLQPQVGSGLSHFFGRIIPSGHDYEEWSRLTQVGKISWWGNRIIKDIKLQMDCLPEHKFYIFNLPEAIDNYDYYKKMHRHFMFPSELTETEFMTAMSVTVNKKDNIVHDWSEQDEKEFHTHAAEWLSIYKKLIS